MHASVESTTLLLLCWISIPYSVNAGNCSIPELHCISHMHVTNLFPLHFIRINSSLLIHFIDISSTASVLMLCHKEQNSKQTKKNTKLLMEQIYHPTALIVGELYIFLLLFIVKMLDNNIDQRNFPYGIIYLLFSFSLLFSARKETPFCRKPFGPLNKYLIGFSWFLTDGAASTNGLHLPCVCV